jgi:acyl-CoA synthetase (AMP-forming)/AMP-acid ligase II/acyl carrier protein
MSTREFIIDRLLQQAADRPFKTAFTVLEDGEGASVTVSYAALATRVRALASALLCKQLSGKTVVMVYQDILEFIVAFLACQYNGIIAVPVAPPKGKKRVSKLVSILQDAGAATVLCTEDLVSSLEEIIPALDIDSKLDIIATNLAVVEAVAQAAPVFNETAFIQYTSGSTGNPKGVVVSARNLWHNQQLLQSAFGCTEDSVILSWLPFHHDMGLTGNILHSIYTGCTCVLMSPLHFIQKPVRWLKAIAQYKVTHSGGPNFAYNLCVERVSAEEASQIDLSSWVVAYNGSEPVRHETLRRFSQHFEASGFQHNAFCPCYGLAEATLLVTAHKKQSSPVAIYFKRELQAEGHIVLCDESDAEAVAIVSSGSAVPGMEVRIIRAHEQEICGELEEGEICISGDSVTQGYWNKDNTEFFYQYEGRKFLRTGDLGFIYNNRLFVHGRLKEMLIIRGRNFYPHDIEEIIAGADNSIEANGVAVFSVGDDESFVVVAEIKRGVVKELQPEAIFQNITNEVAASFGISPYDIVLTTPMGIPRTTSGKLQRLQCRDLYTQQAFTVIASRRTLPVEILAPDGDADLRDAVLERPDYGSIKKYLFQLIGSKLRNPVVLTDSSELSETGLDSLRIMELINTINHDLDINLDASKLFQAGSLRGLITTLENILWLKTKQPFGSEITI